MAEYAGQGKSKLYEELKPCLLGEEAISSYAAVGSKMGMTEGAVKVAVHRLRQKYRRTLEDEIARTVVKPEEIEDEMRHLFSVLSRQ
jgi:RNA polymerase sigma-70 factor (ECF subfamily)